MPKIGIYLSINFDEKGLISNIFNMHLFTVLPKNTKFYR